MHGLAVKLVQLLRLFHQRSRKQASSTALIFPMKIQQMIRGSALATANHLLSSARVKAEKVKLSPRLGNKGIMGAG
jgi:hypothetical protein